MISSKPTCEESARFHVSDYRLVARHNFQVAVTSPPRMPQRNTNLSVGPITMPPAVAPSFGTSAVAECRHQRRHRTSTVSRSNGMVIRRLAASSDSLFARTHRAGPPPPPPPPTTQLANLAAHRVLYDSGRQLLYAPVGSSDANHLDNDAFIDPSRVAGDLHHRSGHDPNRLALSQNGSYLYVGAMDSMLWSGLTWPQTQSIETIAAGSGLRGPGKNRI